MESVPSYYRYVACFRLNHWVSRVNRFDSEKLTNGPFLQGVDEIALLRNVETLYLHVDVLNFGALELYRKAGYRKVNHEDPMFAEFTTSLNLHDGATKGRRHYLLHKDLALNPTWLQVREECAERGNSISKVNTATWGFDIPC